MSSTNDISVLPTGYNFLNKRIMISEKGKEYAMENLNQADARNPDFHDMYIYNDYHAYGVLDIIDKRLSTLHTRLIKKDWPGAMAQLEGLTHFMRMEMVWGMADDGERVDLTVRAYGACLVATLRALKKSGDLSAENHPSLEYLLEAAVGLGKIALAMNAGSEFHRVCKGIGKRLFDGVPREEAKAVHEARYDAWLRTLPADVRRGLVEQNKSSEENKNEDEGEEDEEDKDEGGEGEKEPKSKKPWWYDGVEGAEDEKDSDFALTRVWKEYKDYLSESPTLPLRGPPIWDLNEWDEADKAPFSFDNISD